MTRRICCHECNSADVIEFGDTAICQECGETFAVQAAREDEAFATAVAESAA